jgi:hypothetical protein
MKPWIVGSVVALAPLCSAWPAWAAPPSPNLVQVDQVPAGSIYDADDTRILYDDPATGLTIKDRATGALTVVWAFAITGEPHLYSAGWSQVAPYAGDWVSATPGQRTNLVTGTTETFFTPGGAKACPCERAIGSSGELAWSYFVSTGKQIDAVNADGTTLYTALNPSADFPVIDGNHVVYSWHAGGTGYWGPILLQTPAGTEVLSTLGPSQPAGIQAAQPGTAFRATGGWVANLKVVGAAFEAWTRAPDGTKAKASTYTGASYNAMRLAGLNDKGEIVVNHPSGCFLSAAGAAGPTGAINLGPGCGLMRYFGGYWYMAAGTVLYRVDPSADAGTPDAGSDAGDGDAGDDAGRDDAGDDGSVVDAAADVAADAAEDAGMDSGTDAGVVADSGSSSSSSSEGSSSSGGGSSSGSSGSSSSSGGSSSSSGGSSSGDRSGGGSGGCNVGSSPAEGILTTAFLALTIIAGGRRMRRRR